ncbi:MAG: hypothetical protein ACLP05_07765 [Candidatus Kryptoniota bacterium]
MAKTGRAIHLYILSLVCLICSSSVHAGFERRYSGTRSLGTAGTLCAFGEDPWSLYYNPAHAAEVRELSIFYVPSTLGVQEVKSTGIAYRDNLFGIDFGGAAQTFGFDLYRENVFTLNLSAPIYDFLFVGTNINADHLFISGYGTDLAVSVDAGAKMFLSKNFSLGFNTTNINSASETLSNDRLPQTFTGGVSFETDEFHVGLEYFKEIGFPAAIRIAAEYSPVKFMTVQAGSASGTDSFNAGLAVRFLSFELEYAAAFHQVLGVTQSFGISFDFSHDDRTEFEKIEDYREALRK